jgi:hypothetical protein
MRLLTILSLSGSKRQKKVEISMRKILPGNAALKKKKLSSVGGKCSQFLIQGFS